MVTVTIYSKKECHLCDIAKEELEKLRFDFEFSFKEVDIEKDKIAFEKYKYLIPVIEVDGEIISTYKVFPNKMKALLKLTDILTKTGSKGQESSRLQSWRGASRLSLNFDEDRQDPDYSSKPKKKDGSIIIAPGHIINAYRKQDESCEF
jgi:glutaredoxin